MQVSDLVQGRLVSGSWTPQCLFGSNTLPESLRCDLEEALVPFCCFFSSSDDADDGKAPDLCAGEGEGEGFLSRGEEDEGVDDGRLSRGERAGLGRPSTEDGDVVERGVDGPLVPRPFTSFSVDR